MEETNEVSQALKQAIHDYYMGYIKEKFNFWREDGQEDRISNFIMELASRKIEEGNSIIDKSEVTQILRAVMHDDTDDRMLSSMREDNINSTFPSVATITIEEGQTANLQEVKEKIWGEKETREEYLFVSDEYYNSHIQEIESSIKQFEKAFSSKDIELFDEQFTKDATIKGYELDSAKEYENGMRQINIKQKKYDAVKNRMISDYGKKYQEIMARDISDQEKQTLLQQLLAETKSYDSKTNEAALLLQEELSSLSQRFENRAKCSDYVMKEMTSMHLFDRDRYIQDRKGDTNPELAALYAKREGLTAYRKEHGQPVYEAKPNAFANILNTIARNLRGEKPQLLLEYHPERDIPTGVNPIIAPYRNGVDENLIKTLAHLYGEQVNKRGERFSFGNEDKVEEPNIDTTAFEAHLVKYFRAHYEDLMEEGYNHFLSEFAEMPSEHERYKKEGELAQIARQFGIDPQKFNCFGYKYSIREGLIYEEDSGKLKAVHYATNKGVNSVIEDLYGKALYGDHTRQDSFIINNPRKLKNSFIEYAKEHGIKIENEYTLETMQINKDKVADLSRYLSEMINQDLSRGQEDYKSVDYSEVLAKDISENYSTIMNLDYYSFNDLSSVKSILGDKYLTDGHLRMGEDSILKTDEFSPRIVYATPEYCAREYASIMDKIHTLNATTNPFLDGYFDLTKANAMKTALKTYIQEHGIDVDTSIEQVPVNKERINLIADAMVEKCGDKANDSKTFRSSITKKLQDNWSEIMTEMQVVDVGNMFKDEFKEGSFVHEQLYVRDDFTYLGDYNNYDAKCIYATPQALESAIAKLDETIATRDELSSRSQKKARNILTQYAKDNNIEIDTPSLTRARIRQADRRREESRMFGGLFNDMLPDDPTAREKIDANDTIIENYIKIAEGNPGAITAMVALTKEDPMAFMLISGLDDMNIRGSQIWQVYKYYCNEDVDKFKEVIHNRDADMVQYINELNAAEGQEKAVSGGASFDRNKKPDLYRFTADEVELYREAREERLQKAREEREEQKNPTKKPKEQKRFFIKRKSREDKLKAYIDKLVQKGKETLARKQNRNKQEDISDDYEER